MTTLREYIRKREEHSPVFRTLREEGQPRQNVRLALIQARTAAGLTQQELAQQLGTTQSAIARMESGVIMPRVDTLQQLAQVLGIRIEITPDTGLIIHQPQEQRVVATAGRGAPMVNPIGTSREEEIRVVREEVMVSRTMVTEDVPGQETGDRMSGGQHSHSLVQTYTDPDRLR